MRKVLIIGFGKSSPYLLRYLLEKATAENLYITVADINITQAQELINNHKNAIAQVLNIFNDTQREKAIKEANIVISMLPARFHPIIAKDCIKFKKHMVTASYVSKEMKTFHADAKKNGIILMNEIGVDPGIDHMSAMQVLDRIRSDKGNVILFESFTGGLVAPENDDNLWNYKFTWNPRNVVTAGQGGTAKFIQEGSYKYIPYQRLFRRTEFLDIEGYGRFEVYANRDSLKYQNAYGLQNIKTLYRGTMRRVGFSRAWHIFVLLGMTDDSFVMEGSDSMSYRDFVNAFLPYSHKDSVELKLRHALKIDQDDVVWDKLVELDLFNPNKKVGIENATPAQILQKILSENWTLKTSDRDMIVMYHKFGYIKHGKKQQIDSSMVVIGEDETYTAMAKTVGLPVAIATLLILNKKVTSPGVQIPITKEVYEPILKELKNFDISFNEKVAPYLGYNHLNN